MNARHRSKVGEDVRSAVERGVDVQNTVRDITLKALTGGGLDTQAMRKVAHDVAGGVQLGLERHGKDAGAVLEKAYTGLDEAFAKAAEATTLALKEASGNTRNFVKNDLGRMMDELKTLEDLYLDALRTTASQGREHAATAARQFAEHAANSGTAVGRQVQAGLAEWGPLAHIAQEQLRQGVTTGLEAGALVARAASGFLAAIAERLEPGNRQGPKTKGP